MVLGGPKVFSSATRGAIQALRVPFNGLLLVLKVVLRCSPEPHEGLYRLSGWWVLLKLQWSLMVLGGPKVFSTATRGTVQGSRPLGCCSMVLALSSTISWSKVDYYYGVPVPHEG